MTRCTWQVGIYDEINKLIIKMESAPKEADIPVDGSVESIIFQEKLDDCLTMIDYFFLIGVSEDIVLDTLRKSNYDLKEAKALLDLKEPSILSRFPYHDKKDMPIDRTQLLELPKVSLLFKFRLHFQEALRQNWPSMDPSLDICLPSII